MVRLSVVRSQNSTSGRSDLVFEPCLLSGEPSTKAKGRTIQAREARQVEEPMVPRTACDAPQFASVIAPVVGCRRAGKAVLRQPACAPPRVMERGAVGASEEGFVRRHDRPG